MTNDLYRNLQRWVAAGFEPHPIIPVDAVLAPRSSIKPESRGKVPGLMAAGSDYWIGCAWADGLCKPGNIDRLQAMLNLSDAGVGILARRHPAFDLDILDKQLAETMERRLRQVLGGAPVRIGQPPKRLMTYLLAEGELPLGYRALELRRDQGGLVGRIELLGDGRQYVVHGTHPKTRLPYTWDAHLLDVAEDGMLTEVTADKVVEALEELATLARTLGYQVATQSERSRAGAALGPVDLAALRGPAELVRECVELIPNDPETTRDEWIAMAHAIRGALEDDAEGLELWTAWSLSWEPDSEAERRANTAEGCAAIWRRLHAPRIGIDYLLDRARQHGLPPSRAAQHRFSELPPELRDPLGEEEAAAPAAQPRLEVSAGADGGADLDADDTLARAFVRHAGGELLWVADRKVWYRWSGTHYRQLAEEELMAPVSAFLAGWTDRYFPNDGTKGTLRIRGKLLSTGRNAAVRELARAFARTARADDLDAATKVLATPAGIVELRKGLPIRPATPADLVSHVTLCEAGTRGVKPTRFLDTLGGMAASDDVVRFIQLALGQALLGNPEQAALFLWGRGGDGKSTILAVLKGVLGEMALPISNRMWQDTNHFAVPMMIGRRLTITGELNPNRRLNTDLLKEISGGDPTSAARKFEHEAVFTPRLMPVFACNSAPKFGSVDQGLMRRLYVIAPTRRRPAHDFNDPSIRVQRYEEVILREEAPAVLRWLLDGAERWLAGERLRKSMPASVSWAVRCCVADTDPISALLGTRLVRAPAEKLPLADLRELVLSQLQADGMDPADLRVLQTSLDTYRLRKSLEALGMTVGRSTAGQYVLRGWRLTGGEDQTELVELDDEEAGA